MATSEVLTRELEARDPDITLMHQVRDDVPGAFAVLVERYQDRVLGILAHVVGRVEDAEDLTHEVFLRIYRTRKGYRPKARFVTWVFALANNVAMNHLRSQGRDPSDEPGHAVASGARAAVRPAAQPGSAPVGANPLPRHELAQVVRVAVAALGAEQRMAVLLSKFEQLSYAEIAQVMNRTEPAIMSLLARTRMDLRERLEPYLKAADTID